VTEGQTTAMRIHVEDRLENIGEEAWNSLVSQSGTNTIFQTYQWHVAWWRALGTDKKPFIVCLSGSDGLLAIAPLMVCHEPGGKQILRFIGDGRSDYLDFIYPKDRPELLDEIIGFLKTRQDIWNHVDLKYVPASSPSCCSIPKASRNNGLYCVEAYSTACPALLLEGDADQVMKIVNRKSLKRHRNYFLKKPGYRVKHFRNPAEAVGHMDRFFDQHIERWSVTDTPSLFVDPGNRAFYREVLATMAGTDWIVFTVVESGGSPLAFHFGFAYQERFVWYKPSFDVSLSRQSPGEVLLAELLDYAIDSRFREFDFTVGDEPFKTRFANIMRHNVSYRIVKTVPEFWYQRVLALARKRVRKSGTLQAPIACWRRFRRSTLPRARQAVRKQGLLPSVRKAGNRIFTRILFSYCCVFYFEIPPDSASAENLRPRISDVTHRVLSPQDVLRVDHPNFGAGRQAYLAAAYQRIKRGDDCYVAEHAGKPVLTIWVTYRPTVYVGEVDTKVDQGENGACLYAVVTAPEYRGKNLCSWLECRIVNEHRDKKAITWCKEKNIGSRKMLAKINARLVRKYYLLKILGIKFRWSRAVTGE